MKSKNFPARQRIFTISNGFWLLCALALFFPIRGQSATIQFYMTNSLGVADTNAFRVTPISTPVLADGSWLVTGVPVRITPDANGFAQTNLQRGNYVVSNQFVVGNWGTGPNPIGGQRGVIFAVPNSSGTYSFTSNAISGGNVYNYNGAQFVATYSNIIGVLGFTPLSTNDARAIFPTNTITPGNNITFTTNTGVITIASTATGGSGTNTVSAGTLVTVTTNAPNYQVSALSQTNGFTSITTSNAASFAGTNDARRLTFGNPNNIFSAVQITNGLMISDDGVGATWLRKTNAGGILVLATNTGASFGSMTIDQDGSVRIYGADGDITTAGGITSGGVISGLFQGNGVGLTNVTAHFVVNAVTNQWKLDATNAVTGIATTNTYIAGSGLTFSTNGKPVTVSVTEGTTNRFAFTNFVSGVSNAMVVSSNSMWGYTTGISNRYNPLFPTNSGSDGQIVTKSGTNVYWSTVTGGSGTGIQTNSGTGTNNILSEVRLRNTRANFTLNSVISSDAGVAAVSGEGHNVSGIYSVVVGGLTNVIDTSTASFIGGGNNNYIGLGTVASVIAGGVSNHARSDYEFIGGGGSNVSIGNFTFLGGGAGNRINFSGGGQSHSVLVGGRQNLAVGDWNFIGGGFSNSVGIVTDDVRGSAIVGGISNLIRGDYAVAMGHNATVNVAHDNTFIWSDGRQAISGNSNTFEIFAINGVSINTNDPNGNALNAIGGGVSATNFNIQGDPFIYRHTNVVSVRGAGSIGVDGTYVYLGNQYTNYLTGGTITNNAGTWIILTASLQSAYSFTGTSPVSTNWTLGIGSAPPPHTFFGGYFDPRGFYVLGDFDSTNLAKKYVHPTNAISSGAVPYTTGGDTIWTNAAALFALGNSVSFATNSGTATIAIGSTNALLSTTMAGQQDTIRVPPLVYGQWNQSETNFNAGSYCLTNLVTGTKTDGSYNQFSKYGEPWIFFDYTWQSNALDSNGLLQWAPSRFPSGVANINFAHTNGFKVILWIQDTAAANTNWSVGLSNRSLIVNNISNMVVNWGVDGFWFDATEGSMGRVYASEILSRLNRGTYLEIGASAPSLLSAQTYQLATAVHPLALGEPTSWEEWTNNWNYGFTNRIYERAKPGRFFASLGIGFYAFLTAAQTEQQMIMAALTSSTFYHGENQVGGTIGTNADFLAILEDPGVIGPTRRYRTNGIEMVVKELGQPNGPNYAIGLLSRTNATAAATVNLSQLLINTNGQPTMVYDVKNRTNIGVGNSFTVTLTNSQGTLWRLSPYNVWTNYIMPASYISNGVLPAMVYSNGIVNIYQLPWDSDVTNYIDRAKAGGNVRYAYAAQLAITKLKVAGIWSKLDFFYPILPTGHYANAVSSSYSLVSAGTVTTNDFGMCGDGSTGYWTNNFNPTSAGGHFTQNSASLFVYSGTNSTLQSTVIAGAIDGAGVRVYMQVGNAGDTAMANFLNDATGTGPGGITNWRGLIADSRTDSTTLIGYVKGTSTTASIASTGLLNIGLHFGALYNAGPSFFNNMAIQAIGGGSGLTVAELQTLEGILAEMQLILLR